MTIPDDIVVVIREELEARLKGLREVYGVPEIDHHIRRIEDALIWFRGSQKWR